MCYLLIAIVIGLVGFIWMVTKGLPAAPICGIYNVPGDWYWLKFRLMKFVIARRQKQSRETEAKPTSNKLESEFGGQGTRSIEELEGKHTFPADLVRPVDAVFFDGCNKEGWYITLGTAQRKDDIIQLFFILRIPDVGTFVNPEILTDTNVKSLPSKNEWKTASGFTVKCDKPMEKWTITYDGNLVKSPGFKIFKETGPETPNQTSELIKSNIKLTWTNFGEYFDFDKEVSPTSIAHSLAIEPWSRPLFDKLKSSHQTHYEQFGFIEGNFQIGSDEYKPSRITSMRDHTIASHRNWSDIRRYIMMIYHLDDGTCIHTSVISMPETAFTQLEFGYIITPDKKKIAVDRVFFQLPHHGEDKNFPSKFHYSFQAGHLHYNVDVEIEEVVSFKMGLDQACQVNESMAKFTANGIKGQGFAEVEYRISPY